MNKRQLMSRAVHYALVTGATAMLAGYASTASAANATNTPAHLGKVTVTGTRIKRTNIETAQPNQPRSAIGAIVFCGRPFK